MKIKANAFTGLTQLNGQTIKPVLDSDKKPIKGASGETHAYDLVTGGRVFLRPDQVEGYTQ